MRQKIHGVFAWVVLLSIAVVFIFGGTVGLRLTTNNFIDVNGERVYPQDISLFKQVYPNSDLIQVTVGMQELKNVGFTYSDEQLDEVIKNSPLFKIDGKFSTELYQRYLANNSQQLQSIRKGIYFNSLSNQMFYALQLAQVSFPGSNEWYYKLMDQKRNVSVLTVNQDKFLNDVKLEESDLLKYYEDNKSNFIEPVKVKLEYIKIHYPDIVDKVKVTNSEVENYYNNNLDQYIVAGQKKISQIVIDMKSQDATKKLEEIKKVLKDDSSTESFGKLAEQYSDDKLTASKQGDAGWFQVGDMGAAVLDKALADLTKDVGVSPVITYEDNWFIFKLLDQKPQKQQALSEVKSDIMNKLAEQRANNIYIDLKEQLERKSFEISDALEIVAEELGVKIYKTDWINNKGLVNNNLDTAEDDINSIANNQKVLDVAFSEDVLEDKNNSPLIEIDAQTSLVLRVSEYQAQQINPYEKVKDRIKQELSQSIAKEKALETARKLWNDFVSNGISLNKLEKLSKDNKYVKFEKPQSVSYLDTFWGNADSNLRQELISAFDLPKPTEQYPLQAKLLHLENGDQSILAIDQVTMGEYQNASADQKQQTANQLKYFRLLRDNANFYNRVYNNVKVKSFLDS